jgi:RNA polymerase sigma-70 factor (ECF subfamily)
MAYRLSTPFLEAFAKDKPSRATSALEKTLEKLLEQARAAWPGVEIDASGFMNYLGARVSPDKDGEPQLTTIQASDLYLACACALGNPAAVQALDRRYLVEVGAIVGRLDASPAFVDEVKQVLRERLLVAKDGQPPRIEEYAGRGALGGWLRTAAMRTALNLRRRTREVELGSEVARVSAPTSDPAIGHLKMRYAREFNEAFAETLRSLPIEERNLLRLYFLKGMTTSAIGAALGVHNATVGRRIARARERIIEQMRELLSERLRVDPEELESIIGLMQSQLDVTISRLLQLDEP